MITLSTTLVVNLADKGASVNNFLIEVIKQDNQGTLISEVFAPDTATQRYYQFTLDLSGISPGSYMLNIYDGETSNDTQLISERAEYYGGVITTTEKTNEITWQSK